MKEIVGPHTIKSKDVFYEGKGCDACNGTGYHGRIGVHEVLVIQNGIRDAILRKASASEIKAIAVAGGMKTMIEDGILKARAGLTTIREVLKVAHE